MPWKMVNVDGKRVTLKKAVDEIFSNQDELTNSTYVTLNPISTGGGVFHPMPSKWLRTPQRNKLAP